MNSNQTALQTTQGMIEGIPQDDLTIMFLFMMGVIIMASFGSYIIGKKIISATLTKRKKKKILQQIKSIQMRDGAQYKFKVHTFDEKGIPSLVETKENFEFL